MYNFFPFWDGKLNRRTWVWDQPDNDELRLLEKYAKHGLTLENLAFRRWAMANDPEIRRNPELFGVFYPFDDLTCWLEGAGGIIPSHCLRKHLDTIEAWPAGTTYLEYEHRDGSPIGPKAGAYYVIGCDPAGWGGRDHAAFHVLEVWDDQWEQVATFGSPVDPPTLGEALLKAASKFNNARIAIERNGVGAGAISYIIAKGYGNIHVDKAFKPGVHKHSHDQMITTLVDALLDKLIMHDKDTVDQLSSYRGDKLVERSQYAEIISGNKEKSSKRRARHHWDKVSALAIACIAAKVAPTRIRQKPASEVVAVSYNEFDQWEKYLSAIKKPSRASTRAGARGYRSVRRGK